MFKKRMWLMFREMVRNMGLRCEKDVSNLVQVLMWFEHVETISDGRMVKRVNSAEVVCVCVRRETT